MLPMVGIIAAALSALGYAFVDVHSPVAGYPSVVFVAFLAAGTAFPVAYGAKVLGCRNPTALKIIGVGSGLLAVYLAWAFFAAVLSAHLAGSDVTVRDLFAGIARPDQLIEFVWRLNETGWYSLGPGQEPLAGLILWVFWALEALIVVGTSYVLATRFIVDLAFCETCAVWCEPADRAGVAVPVIPGRMVKSIRTEGLAALVEVPAPNTEAKRFLDIELQRCPKCAEFGVFGVNQRHVSTSKRNKKREIAEVVIPVSVIRPEDDEHITRIRAEIKAARGRQFDAVREEL